MIMPNLEQLPELFQPFQDKILATVKPAVTLTLTAASELSLWQSKVGGQPYLPLDTAYPQDGNGQPLVLLTQINFAEVPPLADFPTQGILQFYIATDDVYGLDFDNQQNQSGFRVLYFENIIDDISQLKQNFSDIYQLNEDNDLTFTGQYAVKFQLRQQAISPNDFNFGRRVLDVDQLYDYEEQYQGEDFYEEWIEPYTEIFPETGHRLGGYPFFTQSDPREYNEDIQDYILLLQLDTDSKNNLMWGDAGVVNFFIHPDDLKKRDFSKILYNWDCC